MPNYDITLVNAGPNVPKLTDGRLVKPPPLGVLALTAYLERHGHRVQLLDYQQNDYALNEQLLDSRFLEFIEGLAEAPIIGVSTMGGMLPVVLLALERFKARHPNQTLILGGSGPSQVAARIVQRFRGVDAVVRGEGEETLLDLLSRPHDFSSVRGITYMKNGGVVQNPPREKLRDLDSLPWPAYHAIDMERYAVANIHTTRGCPFRCGFCEAPSFWGKPVTMRSVDSIMDELRELRFRYNKRRISISDDSLMQRRDRAIEFCRRLIEEKLDIEWECFGRIDLMDEKLMEWMARSGCTLIFYGVESGADKVLEAMDKGIRVEQAIDVVERSLKYFETVYASFVWGLPFETLEDFFATVLLMMSFACQGVHVQRPYLSLRPGSPLYERYKDRIAFAEDLPLYFLEVSRDHLPEKVIATVRSNPDIFPGYYYVDGPDFVKKKQFMQRLESLGPKAWNVLREKVQAALCS